jgi:hypothetical protein
LKLRDERAKRWTAFWIPLLSAAVALIAVIGGVAQGSAALRAQADLKGHELSFAPKQQAYAGLMRDHVLLYHAVTSRSDSARQVAGNDMEATYYELDPFLTDSLRSAVRNT